MRKPTQEMVDAFFEWYWKTAHSKNEDHYIKTITREKLSQLSREDFIEFFFQFAREGGLIQSGGQRTAPRFRTALEDKYEMFRKFALDPFDDDFDEARWLERISEFKGFGQGLASIYLNRVDKSRFAIINNKAIEAIKLMDVNVPPTLVGRYEAVKDAENRLIKWFPEFNNFYRTDALTHFLTGEKDGEHWADELRGSSPQDMCRYWIYAPGERARMWEQYSHEGVIGIGWDKFKEDLSSYKNKEQFQAKYKGLYSDQVIHEIFDFIQNVREGDKIFVKRGTKEIVGFGEVTSSYFYDGSRPEYRHLRRVNWLKQGEWKIAKGMKKLPVKTLTELQGRERIEQLMSLLSESGDRGVEGDAGMITGQIFTQRTFDLLSRLHEHPTATFYNDQVEDFKKHLEEPLQKLLKAVADRVPEPIKKFMETKKRIFSRIPKNDWGRGGAWDFYWGAFYPKGGKRIADPQLFLYINSDLLGFGFYIGEYGKKSRERFAENCQKNLTVLKSVLEPSLSDERFIFGAEGSAIEYRLPKREEKSISWDKWLEDPEAKEIRATTILPSKEVLRINGAELVDMIVETFQQLFPLVLLAYCDEPLDEIMQYLEAAPGEPAEVNPPYLLEKCATETHFELGQLERWVKAIERKKQAIFYGPPGTGKTFIAEKLGKHLIGDGDGFCEIIQFHPSYAYEDFMQGLRPTSVSDGRLEYVMVPGRFIDFCSRARDCTGRCVLIIDEINRANLSRALGELMFLLEYRDQTIPLAGGKKFQIPDNVRIIGTMNTADRSIALVDHALRRRFAFLGLYPEYDVLRKYHGNTGFDPKGLIAVLERLNAAINDKHFSVGISYFLQPDIEEKIQCIWEVEIEPYIEELFFDQADKAASFSWEKVKEEIVHS